MSTAKQVKSRGGKRANLKVEDKGAPRGENEAALKGLGSLQTSATSTGKEAKPSYTKVVQAEPKTVTQKLTVPKKVLEEAIALAESFHNENVKLDEYKSLMEKTRNSMSELVFGLAKLAAANAPAGQLRLATFDTLCESVEQYEMLRFAKSKGMTNTDDVAVKDALGSSWRTYKSQIRKGIHAGFDPAEFANSTAYRTAGSPPQARGTKSRKTKGGTAPQDSAVTTPTLDVGKMHHALTVAVNAMIDAVKATDPDDQMAAADIIAGATMEVQKLLTVRTLAKGKAATAKPAEETSATASL